MYDITAFNNQFLFSFSAADWQEVSRLTDCNLRTSLVSCWERTSSLLFKQAPGFSRSHREHLGFQSQDGSEWQDFWVVGGRSGFCGVLLPGSWASTRWQPLLENKTHFVSPSLDKTQISPHPLCSCFVLQIYYHF